jgi:hypothetical protein
MIRIGELELMSNPLTPKFQGKSHLRVISEAQNIVIPAPGTMDFFINQGTQVIASWAIRVHQIGAPVLAIENTAAL